MLKDIMDLVRKVSKLYGNKITEIYDNLISINEAFLKIEKRLLIIEKRLNVDTYEENEIENNDEESEVWN